MWNMSNVCNISWLSQIVGGETNLREKQIFAAFPAVSLRCLNRMDTKSVKHNND